MSDRVRLYQCGSHRVGFDEVERSSVLSKVSCNELFEKHIDYFFHEYIDEKCQSNDSVSSGCGHFYHAIFSQHSFAAFLQSTAKDKIDTLISDKQAPLSQEEVKELLGGLQETINDYCEKHKINHSTLSRYWNGKGQSPYGYGLLKMLEDEGYINTQDHENTNATQAGYMFEQFFSDYLANIFFKKTQEAARKDEEIHETLTLHIKANEYITMLLGLINSIPDETIRNYYGQGVYNMTTSKEFTTKDAEKFTTVFDDFLEAYEKDEKIDIADIQEQAKGIFRYNFSKYLPVEGKPYTVYLKNIGTTTTFVHVDSFYFDDSNTKPIPQEKKNIEEMFGNQGHMDANYREKSNVLIKDASMFNARGEKVWRGDFDFTAEHDYAKLTGTYYILTQQDSMRPGEGAILAEEKIPDSDAIKATFYGLGDTHKMGDFTQPTRLKKEYMKAKAQYKIQDGKLTKNVFAFS